MLTKSILQWAIFAFCLSTSRAKFINKISETEYEMNLNERGANFTQKISLDNDHNLVITEVPAHHDRVAITYIYDASNGLAITVSPSSKMCKISRPFISLSGAEQKAFLDDAALDDSPEDRMEINSTTATLYDLAQIEGPQVNLECIPENFKKFVPTGYQIFLTHEVQITKENVHRMSNNLTNVFFTDPLSQKRYEYGDHVELFGDVFDFLPQCISKPRVKRQSTANFGEQWTDQGGRPGIDSQSCRDEKGNIVRCYGLHSVECTAGCDKELTGYDCIDSEKDCHYVLVCSIVAGDNCILHLQTDYFTCKPCCRIRDCGENLARCKYLPDAKREICPSPGLGCHVDYVVKSINRQQTTDKFCNVDLDCEYVMSDDGEARGSGVSCQKARRANSKKEEFCCEQPSSGTQYQTTLQTCGQDNTAIRPASATGCHNGDGGWDCCSSSNKCGEGEGDCDNDDDCFGTLKCGEGNGYDSNCNNSNYPDTGYDCCYDPNKPIKSGSPTGCHNGGGGWDCCSSSNKCGEGEGECDNDEDCFGNLKCGTDNCDTSRFPESGYDCCVKP